MIIITFYYPNGKIRNYTTVPDRETAERASSEEGLPFIEGMPVGDCYVDNGEFVPMPPRPDNACVFDYETKAWKDPRTLEDIKSKKVLEINAAFDVASAALTEGYPVAERLTWPMQQAEALAWGADNTTPTPFLDGLAAARGITPEEIRQKALEVVQQFINGSQMLIGTRQRLRDAVDAATTREEVEAVAWPT